MDFRTILAYVGAVLETAMLLAALVFATKALKTRDNEVAKKAARRNSVICLGIYLVLNFLRNTFGYGV